MDVGKINTLHVTTDPKKFRNCSATVTYFYLTTANEEQFRELLDAFLVDNEFERNAFMDYVSENGYICTYLDNESVTEF
ncbi:MAG TPA: hypothetical protein VK426_02095 [Methanobacterium sp.]|nr:hypothetical protein [Methanobacterium sp.]